MLQMKVLFSFYEMFVLLLIGWSKYLDKCVITEQTNLIKVHKYCNYSFILVNLKVFIGRNLGYGPYESSGAHYGSQ